MSELINSQLWQVDISMKGLILTSLLLLVSLDYAHWFEENDSNMEIKDLLPCTHAIKCIEYMSLTALFTIK